MSVLQLKYARVYSIKCARGHLLRNGPSAAQADCFPISFLINIDQSSRSRLDRETKDAHVLSSDANVLEATSSTAKKPLQETCEQRRNAKTTHPAPVEELCGCRRPPQGCLEGLQGMGKAGEILLALLASCICQILFFSVSLFPKTRAERVTTCSHGCPFSQTGRPSMSLFRQVSKP